jgi:hypothetical protein
MRNQSMICCILLFLVSACGNHENTSSDTAAEAATTEIKSATKDKEVIKESSTQTADTETITLQIRKEFGRVETLINGNQVIKKEISYSCPDDPQDGGFIFYFNGDTLLKANHSFVMGDHYGQESSYYFQNGALIFGFHQSSVWSFGGQDDQGNTTTKDDINIQRDYFFQGKLVKQLFKDYAIFSDQKAKKESEIPNQKTGKGVGYTLAGNTTLNVSTKENLTCEMLNE